MEHKYYFFGDGAKTLLSCHVKISCKISQGLEIPIFGENMLPHF